MSQTAQPIVTAFNAFKDTIETRTQGVTSGFNRLALGISVLALSFSGCKTETPEPVNPPVEPPITVVQNGFLDLPAYAGTINLQKVHYSATEPDVYATYINVKTDASDNNKRVWVNGGSSNNEYDITNRLTACNIDTKNMERNPETGFASAIDKTKPMLVVLPLSTEILFPTQDTKKMNVLAIRLFETEGSSVTCSVTGKDTYAMAREQADSFAPQTKRIVNINFLIPDKQMTLAK